VHVSIQSPVISCNTVLHSSCAVSQALSVPSCCACKAAQAQLVQQLHALLGAEPSMYLHTDMYVRISLLMMCAATRGRGQKGWGLFMWRGRIVQAMRSESATCTNPPSSLSGVIRYMSRWCFLQHVNDCHFVAVALGFCLTNVLRLLMLRDDASSGSICCWWLCVGSYADLWVCLSRVTKVIHPSWTLSLDDACLSYAFGSAFCSQLVCNGLQHCGSS